jgi:hypothetical protein
LHLFLPSRLGSQQFGQRRRFRLRALLGGLRLGLGSLAGSGPLGWFPG